MRTSPTLKIVRTSLACCLLAAAFAWAQGGKAGLYDVTTSMSFPDRPAGSPTMIPRQRQVCVSPEQAAKFGGPPPQTRGDCTVTNMVKKLDGYSADVSCTSDTMTGTGTVEASYSPDGHGKTKVHITGTMQMGGSSRPMNVIFENSSVYKGADCGGVKPSAPAN
jgi:choline dehydrogenase-like flavoprotein